MNKKMIDKVGTYFASNTNARIPAATALAADDEVLVSAHCPPTVAVG